MTALVPGITIVGLGPGDPSARTIGVQRALDAADRIILRTRVHPGLDDLLTDSRVSDCDDLYDSAEGFDWLYERIADRVASVARGGENVVFAVPGHPRFGERSVPLIETAAKQANVAVTILDAVSFVDVAANALGVDPLASGLQVFDAEHLAATLDAEPFAAGSLGIDPARPLLVAQVYNAELAAAVKIALNRVYPDNQPVTAVFAAGVPAAERLRTVPLHALDRLKVDHLTSVWVAPLAPLDAVRSPDALIRVVARLRRPDGCPWDRAQDHASLRDSVLEEAFEVADAIDSGDSSELAEELGDLLLLVAMHAQLAEEEGSFCIEDIFETIARKLIRRHPHVFGEVVANSPEAVVSTWEGVKAAEREAKGAPRRSDDPVDRLPRSMPVTRKIVEIFAPRTTLHAPNRPTDGKPALDTIAALVRQGIDPERALEAALRETARQTTSDREALAAVGAAGERGRTQA